MQPWDSRPMNLSGLRLVNVAAKVTLKELVIANARIAPGPIDATIFDGVLSVAVADSRAYNGTGQGRLVVDASQDVPTHSLRIGLAKIEALPLLIDTFAFPHLAGQMQAYGAFQSKGDSPAAIVAALDGTAKVLIENGTVEGLENMIGAVPMNIWQAWSGSSEKTAFGTFGATFNVSNGQAATDNLVLDGPYVRASGKGSVSFASKSVDFTVEPTVVVGKNNANRDANAIRLGVPVTIRGPWNNPQVSAQLSNINPEAATKTIQALTDGLFSSPPGKPGSLDSMMKGMRDMLEQGTATRKPARDPAQPVLPRDPTQPPPPARTAPGVEAQRDSVPPGNSKEETPGAKEMQDSIQGILKDLLKDR
jgi:AsmA protein